MTFAEVQKYIYILSLQFIILSLNKQIVSELWKHMFLTKTTLND